MAMKVLQLCHKLPYPVRDGGSHSLLSTALGLASHEGVQLQMLAIHTPKDQAGPQDVPEKIRDRIGLRTVFVDTQVRKVKAVNGFFSGKTYFMERFRSGPFNDALIALLEREEFDAIQLEHLYLTPYIGTIREHSKAKIVLRPQNVESMVWDRIRNRSRHPLYRLYLEREVPKLRRLEIRAAAKVDGILAIAPHDEAWFQTHAPGIPVEHVPIGFDLEDINVGDPELPYRNFPVFYHLGAMDWTPNVQGMKWFIRKVVPEICRQYPDFRIRIAGKKMPEEFSKKGGDRIINDGEVPDARIYQSDKVILLVPLLSGGGLRAKIVEAMALGKTVISTTIGAEGIPWTNGKDILIADTPEAFARQVLACKDSPEYCREIGENARRLAVSHYDLKTTSGQMIRFYEKLTEEQLTSH